MEITIILGDRLLPKKAAVESAMAAAQLATLDVEMFCLDAEIGVDELIPHANPDYVIRTAQQRRAWKHSVRRIRTSRARYGVVICSAYAETVAGPELIFPIDILRTLANTVSASGGTIEVVCLIDDVFGSVQNRALDLSRGLNIRQLEWTFSQYVASQLRGKLRPGVSCFSLQHPVTNLSNKILRNAVSSVYLCYPINFFRRNPTHPLKADLNQFKSDLAESGLIVYDPLAIDEEVLISETLGKRGQDTLMIMPTDRWPMPRNRILFTEPDLDANGEGLISPLPTYEVARQAKAQVPQRDFFWIESADAVISWRPFLGNTHHAGVLAELQFAIHKNKPIVAFSPKEDGSEHPSPFASMVSTLPDAREFLEVISGLSKRAPDQRRVEMESDMPPEYCDHTSVGVLIYNEKNELLLIERGTFPFGLAAPAGHVDHHSSYEKAAIAEVREEVGLKIEALRLVAEGRKDNPCRRVNGSWHYWKVYEAKASGVIKLSPREVKHAEWCNLDRLVELGMVSAERAEASRDSLERVWLDWLYELKILPPSYQISELRSSR